MKGRALKLGTLRYHSIAPYGYGDEVAPRNGGPSAKYVYLRDCKKFLRAVAAGLPSEFACKVESNPGGFAVPGDAHLVASRGDLILYVSVRFDVILNSGGRRDDSDRGRISDLGEGHASLFWRFGHKAYAVDGVNMWVTEGETLPSDIVKCVSFVWLTKEHDDGED